MATDHDAALAQFLAGKPVDIGKVLRSLPAKPDVPLAVAAVLRLVDHPHWLATSCAELPTAVIRAVLAETFPGMSHLFLRLAVPAELKAAPLKAAWQRAVAALRDLADTTHPWETDARREMLAALAREPLVLAALQGLVAHTQNVTIDMLAVLAIDGGDASVDALIPHLDPALGERDARLERLAMLHSCVKRTPALAALFAELDAALEVRRSGSPALALGPVIGIGEHQVLWVHFMLTSNKLNDLQVPRVQGNVRIDSREDPWFSVWVSTVAGSHDRGGDRTTRFDERGTTIDELKLGACTAAELPDWLRQSAKRLKVQWQRFLLRTNVADDQRPRIEQWLVAKP